METKTFAIDTVENRKIFVETMVYSNTTKYTKLGETYTIAIMLFPDGWSVQGKSVCVNPADYNPEIGERIAYDNCMDKAFTHYWRTCGYMAMIGMKEITVPVHGE